MVSLPPPAEPLNLYTFAKKKHYDFPCFEAPFISLFILMGLGS